MKIFTKKLILASLSVFLAGMVFAPAVSAQTPDNLVIEFESDPLFSEVNFIPGDGVDRWIKATNNSPDTQSIIIEAINFSNPGELGDNLELTIKEGSTELYKDTLANFFSYGEVYLSDLTGGGGNTQYDLNIKFPEGADTSSMEDTLGFDILIGFRGEGDNGGGNGGGGGDTVVTTGGGGSGGGGGGSYRRGLTISNEAVFNIIPQEGTAQAFWNTSYAATSQVIYGLVSGGPYYIDLNDSNFGYPYTTPENTTKVTEHYVDLAGLIPGETYNYRVVSYASPATISYEYTFTVPDLEIPADNNPTDNNNNPPVAFTSGNTNTPNTPVEEPAENKNNNFAATNTNTSVSPPQAPAEPEQEKENLENKENVEPAQQKNVGLASILGAFSLDSECFFTFLIVLAILLLTFYFLRKKEGLRKTAYFVFAAVMLAAAIFGYKCLAISLLVSLILYTLWLVLKRKQP